MESSAARRLGFYKVFVHTQREKEKGMARVLKHSHASMVRGWRHLIMNGNERGCAGVLVLHVQLLAVGVVAGAPQLDKVKRWMTWKWRRAS